VFNHNVVRVNLADLDNEKEGLAKFLLTHFKLNSSLSQEGLGINSEDVSSHALAKMVNKFLYSKHFNSTHWVSVGNNVVKINKFNQKKEKKNKHPTTPSLIKHGW